MNVKFSTLFVVSAFSTIVSSVNVSAYLPIEFVTSDPGGFTISYRPGEASIDTVDVNGKLYHRLSFDSHTTKEPVGSPDTPGSSFVFAAPEDAAPILNVTDLKKHTQSGIHLSPVPRFLTSASGMAEEQYEENLEKYAMSGFQPKSHVSLEKLSAYGSLRLWKLTLFPALFDARSHELSVADSLLMSVSFAASIERDKLPNKLPDYVLNAKVFQPLFSQKPALMEKNPFDNGDWYKLTVDKSGMYSVSGNDLSKAGFPIASIPVNSLRLYYNGGRMIDLESYDFTSNTLKEVAIKVNDVAHDGVFNSNDTIIFYGESLNRFYTQPNRTRLYYQNHVFSDTNVYWLTISSEGTPIRMQTTGLPIDDVISAKTVYQCSRHIENDYQLELSEGGIEWFWDSIFDNIRTFTIATPGAVPGYPATFRIGMLNQVRGFPHQVYIYVNDEKYMLYPFSAPKGFVTHISTGDLKSGNNELHLGRKYQPGESNISVNLDYIEVDYIRTLSFDENNLEMFVSGDGSPIKYTISNVNRSSVTVFNTTDPFAVKEFSNVRFELGAKTLTFQLSPVETPHRLIISDLNSPLKVTSVSRKVKSNLTSFASGTNYIVIAPTVFMGEAKKLAEWRARDSAEDPLVPLTADINDIIDDFNGGIYDPLAIRNFLKYIWDAGDSGRQYYCCIIGDTTFKYKNLTSDQIGKNLVPTYSFVSGHDYLTTDEYFCWFDSSRMPSFAMGRLCASDKETATALVNKIVSYEKNGTSGQWRNRILLVADDEVKPDTPSVEIQFTTQTEELDNPRYFPENLERNKILLIEYPLVNKLKPDVTESMIKAINDGVLLTNFIGHGNDDLLAHEHIFVGTRDIGRLTNDKKPSLFLMFSCSVGKFTLLDNISLAEMLSVKKEGGAIGVIAATNETYASTNFELNKQFYIDLFNRSANKEYRVGLALRQSKINVGNGDNLKNYLYFGDPATRLMVPRYGFSSANIDSVYRLQHLTINGTVKNGTEDTTYNGTLYITARGPKIQKTYTPINSLAAITYTQPGRIFYYGMQTIGGNSFNTGFVVPKDLPSSDKDACIYLFATGQDQDASGALSGFTIGGLDPNAPDDRTGPEMKVSFDGKLFENGDYISRQPAMRLAMTDQSGINVYGNRGHNITLLIDNTEIIVLTDLYKAENGFTNGAVEYLLPVLTPGEHTLEMTAYDTYNNASKLSVTANVVGSESGDIAIMNLLNYPNPMKNDGTIFTFSLTDDARSADIKVYTQSGRLVDSFKFSASYGFNQIDWKPPFSIANGVYFYKLSVRSVNGRKASKIEKLVVMK